MQCASGLISNFLFIELRAVGERVNVKLLVHLITCIHKTIHSAHTYAHARTHARTHAHTHTHYLLERVHVLECLAVFAWEFSQSHFQAEAPPVSNHWQLDHEPTVWRRCRPNAARKAAGQADVNAGRLVKADSNISPWWF